MSIPHRNGCRTVIPSNLKLWPDERVDSLHADAIKLKAIAHLMPEPAAILRWAALYERTIKGQTIEIWVDRPLFCIPINLSDLIPVDEVRDEPCAFYIKEEICK